MKLLMKLAPVVLLFVAGCSKQDVQPLALQNDIYSYENNVESFASKLTRDNTTGNYIVDIQPGEDGNDLWYKYWKNHDKYANENDTEVNLVKALTWKVKGTKLITRSVIKFDSLVKIPSTVKIVSAKLYLYGPTPSSPDVSVHLPMGNSSYPGSSYNENTTLIQRISSPWETSTICWNNQPATATTGQVVLSPSTEQWRQNIVADVTEMVKIMVNEPSKNYGFMLKLNNENIYRSFGFYSSEYYEAGKRPKLAIEFSL